MRAIYSIHCLCIVLDKYVSFRSSFPKTVFSCLLVSAPIFTELFPYNGTCLSTGGGFLFVALSLYVTTVCWETKNHKRLFIPALLLAACTSWYEALLVVYVEAVFALLILKYLFSESNVKLKDILLEGFYFAGPLVAGVVAELIFQIAFIKIFNISQSANAVNSIKWFSGTPVSILGICREIVSIYLMPGFWYQPFTVFLVCICICGLLCLYYCFKKKSAIPLLLFAGLILTNFALTFLRGEIMPNRTCQSLSLFVAFSVLLLLLQFEKAEPTGLKKFAQKAICLFASYLIIFQISACNYWFFWDYQRYQEEVTVVKQVSLTLAQNYDITKPVVFTGEYELSENILDHSYLTTDSFGYKFFDTLGDCLGMEILNTPDEKYVRKIPNTNVSSYITWSIGAFKQGDAELFKFIRFHGIDYLKQGSVDMFNEGKELAKDMPEWPQKGSICDMGEYILVNF